MEELLVKWMLEQHLTSSRERRLPGVLLRDHWGLPLSRLANARPAEGPYSGTGTVDGMTWGN